MTCLKKKKYKSILFFPCAGSSLLCGLFSSCSEWELLFIAVCSLLIAWLLLLQNTGSMYVGSVVVAPRL